MQTYQFFIKYKEHHPVKISTHFDSERKKREVHLEDVADLVAAFQALSSKLGAIDLDELTLHLPEGFCRSALDEDSFAGTDSTGTTLRTGLALERLDGLGIDDLQPLVIKSKIAHVLESVEDTLKRFGIEYSAKDINYLLDKDHAGYLLLKSNPTKAEAQRIISAVKSRFQSATRKAIGLQHGIFLDGALNAGQGQSKSTFLYAFTPTGGVLVAKVYSVDSKDDFDREVLASNAFHHPNVVKFLKSFSILGKGHIIIMPYFPRTAHDFMDQYTSVPMAAIATVARDIHSAVAYIHENGYCFADVKPSNIVLDNQEQGKAVLVDFGGTVKLGSSIIEVTDMYCLDFNASIASVYLDWICFASTLSQLAGIDISSNATIASLWDAVNSSDIDPLLKNVIRFCLNAESRSSALAGSISLFIETFLPS